MIPSSELGFSIDSASPIDQKRLWLTLQGIDYCCADALVRYEFDGEPVGSFLQAVLENRLVQSFQRADSNNLRRMDVYARYLYDYMPSNLWGSPEIVSAWIRFRFRSVKETGGYDMSRVVYNFEIWRKKGEVWG